MYSSRSEVEFLGEEFEQFRSIPNLVFPKWRRDEPVRTSALGSELNWWLCFRGRRCVFGVSKALAPTESTMLLSPCQHAYGFPPYIQSDLKLVQHCSLIATQPIIAPPNRPNAP